MGMIKIYARSSKQKRKPGWQQTLQQEAEWLASINSMKLAPGKTPVTKRSSGNVRLPKPTPAEVLAPLKAKYVVGGGTKEVLRPEITYKDDPEMLARELAARQIKHNTAPAYNKGGDVYVTQEELQRQLAGNKRRP